MQNTEYEQYLSLNERNYAIYGQNSSNKDEQSNFVRADLIYGRDAVQESFSNLKKFKSRFVRQGLSLVGSPLKSASNILTVTC